MAEHPPLPGLRELGETLRQAEDISQTALDSARETYTNTRNLAVALAAVLGLSPGVMDMLAASARHAAAAELSFAAAVESREANARLIRQLEDLGTDP